MKIIFCNIAYQRYYDGRIAGEIEPTTGGRWVQENKDAHEKWNFLNMDGNCYGYVQASGEQLHIERLGKVYRQQDSSDEVTVIWCAAHPTRGTVVVGWYENATAYRELQEMRTTPATGLERWYCFSCKSEDAYLLPENQRTLTIGRSSKDGAGKGFGQANVWWAESEYAKHNIIPDLIDFIHTHKAFRINALTGEFMDNGNTTPLTKLEMDYADSIADEQSKEFLPYGYRIFANDPTADNAYKIAASLNNCYQYRLSIPWYEKTIELDPDDISTRGILAYVYQQVEQFDRSSELGREIQKLADPKDEAIRDELYCIFADNCYFKGEYREALAWQQRIINESHDKNLIEHTKHTMDMWKQMI